MLNKLTIYSHERPTDFDIVCSMAVELRRLSDGARTAAELREGIEQLMAQVQAHYLANVEPLAAAAPRKNYHPLSQVDCRP